MLPSRFSYLSSPHMCRCIDLMLHSLLSAGKAIEFFADAEQSKSGASVVGLTSHMDDSHTLFQVRI